MSLSVTFLGHACWLIKSGEYTLIIDPFLQDNPLAPIEPEDIQDLGYVLVTHAHWDHLGDTVNLASRHDALVISTAEVATMIAEEGVRTHGMHLGGTHDFDFGTVRVFPAFHGSGVPGGHAAGFVLTTPEGTVYHAGDTALFSDMKLLNGVVVERVDLALLPIGNNYTMGVDDAVLATKWIKPRVVSPMHYNTWPVIKTDPDLFKSQVEAATDTRTEIVEPGGSFVLDEQS